jgi:hypothetical protein
MDDAPNCGALGCPSDLADASIGKKADAVLQSCAGGPESNCHGVGAGGLHLPDIKPTNILNVPSSELPQYLRVATGDPEHSYLYMKVTGDSRIVMARMPKDLSPLMAADIETLRSWIEAGAPSP